LNVLASFVTGSRDILLDVRVRIIIKLKTGYRTRVRRREMTMEYVGFTIFIAASGAIIIWFWHRYATVPDARSRREKGALPQEPIPPLKRTVSGPRPKELEQVEFLDRIDVWQKEHQVQQERYARSLESLNGTKYCYQPRKREQSVSASPAP